MKPTGKNIHLRALEPEDLDFLFKVENDEQFWEISGTQTPFSKQILREYLHNAHRDIYEVKQLRMVIAQKDAPIGLIDIFDFDPKNFRAGLGILIAEKENRGKGYGKEALELICNYCFAHLNLHQVYANVSEENLLSQQLFENLKFDKVGVKRDWNFTQGKFNNVILYQLLAHVH